jgi:hypothetical protein
MNRVTCLHCGATIISRSQHEYVTCRCATESTRVAVDGGEAYQRRGFGLYAWWEEPDGRRRGLCPLCGLPTCALDCPCAGKTAEEIVALMPKLPAYNDLLRQWAKADRS